MRIIKTDCTPEEVQPYAGATKVKRRSDGNRIFVGVLRWNNHARQRTSVSGNRRIDMQEYFEFLEDLRDSGSMNMMGAPRELQACVWLR